MGSGIAQVCAMAGHVVGVVDSDPSKGDAAIESTRASLEKLAAKDRLGGESPVDVLVRLSTGTSIAQACEGVDVVIETVVERLDVKHDVFREIVASAPSDALLGTNTSQLSITRVASVLGDQGGRLIGMHFFNPPVLMRLVELVVA